MSRKTVLVQALRAAGQTILQYDPATLESTVKSTAGDFVTAADLASEKLITDTILAAFPEDLIISEETKAGHQQLTADFTGWVVDPLDGTHNFKRGMAYSCIAVGYAKSGTIILSGVFDPYRDKLYIAELGQGATCNGSVIHVANKTSFDAGTRVCTSNAYEAGGTQANLDRYDRLGHVWVDVLNSAVLNMAYIASGNLDIYHHNGLRPWDNAAGFLLACEAGAKLVDLRGQPITWLSSEAVIGNPGLVDLFIKKINN